MAAPARFRTVRKALGPRWLTSGEGGLLGYSLDLLKDGFVESTRRGLMARLPQNSPDGEKTAPEDALETMGRDRRVVRGINETSPSYARRLLNWLDDRKRAGNPFMLMQKLAEYTGPGTWFRVVDARGNYYKRDVDGVESYELKRENWNWDGEPVGRHWARFWVIVYPAPSLWVASGNLGSMPTIGQPDTTIGTTATIEHVAKMRFIVNDWRRPGSRCVNIIIAFLDVFGPSFPAPDGSWALPGKVVDGAYVSARSEFARYWGGRQIT